MIVDLWGVYGPERRTELISAMRLDISIHTPKSIRPDLIGCAHFKGVLFINRAFGTLLALFLCRCAGAVLPVHMNSFIL